MIWLYLFGNNLRHSSWGDSLDSHVSGRPQALALNSRRNDAFLDQIISSGDKLMRVDYRDLDAIMNWDHASLRSHNFAPW